MADELTDGDDAYDDTEERLFHERIAATKLLLGDLDPVLQANVIRLALGVTVLNKFENDHLDRNLNNASDLFMRVCDVLKEENGNYPIGKLAGIRLHQIADQALQQIGYAGVVFRRYRNKK